MKHKLFRQLIGVSSLRAIGAACTFLTTILAGRVLGNDAAGTYFWAISFTSIISSISRLGLDKAFIRIGGVLNVRTEHISRGIFKFSKLSIVLSLALSTLSLIYFYSLSQATHSKIDTTTTTLIIITPALISITVIRGSLELGRGNILRGTLAISFIPSFTALSLSIFLFLLTKIEFLTALLFSSLTGWLTAYLFLSYSLIRKKRINTNHPETCSQIAEIQSWKSSLVFFGIIGLANCMEQWLPTLVSGIFFLPSHTAEFGAASRIIGVFQMIMASAGAAFSHRYISASQSEILRIFKKSTLSIIITTTPALFLIAISGPYILDIFGKDFREGTKILEILLAAQLFNIAFGSTAVILMMRGHVQVIAKIFGTTLAFHLAASFFSGYIGSPVILASSSAITTILQSLLSAYAFKKIYLRSKPKQIKK